MIEQAQQYCDDWTEREDLFPAEEPYCHLLDQCLLGGFKDPQCFPKSCPFNNDYGCLYIAQCASTGDVDVHFEELI